MLALAFHPNCEVATKIRQRRPPILLLASGFRFHNVQSYSHVQSLSIRPRRGRRPPPSLIFPIPASRVSQPKSRRRQLLLIPETD